MIPVCKDTQVKAETLAGGEKPIRNFFIFGIINNKPMVLQANNPIDYDFILKAAGGLGGLVLFVIGLIRYTRDQTWKRHEFVAKEIKEFNGDKMVRNTMYMLDWGSRYIELFYEHPDPGKRYAKVTRATLRAALQSHKFKSRFTRTEVAIRDHFDHFLNRIEMFEQFIEAELITKKEVEPYLKYWIETIGEDLEEEMKNTIYHYINEYGYQGVQKLFDRFGKNICPAAPLETTRLDPEEQIDTSDFENENPEES